MSPADRFAWAVATAVFSDQPVTLPDASILTVKPALALVTCPEHRERVERKHGPLTADTLVPVITHPDGTVHHKWGELRRGATA